MTEHMANAFTHAITGMSLISLEHRPLRINRAMCDFLGYFEPQAMALDLAQVVHPDDLAEDYRQRDMLLQGAAGSYRHEKRYLHRDGHVLWGDYCCSIVRDARGNPLHFLTQVQDITQRKEAEDELRSSEARFRSLCDLTSDWYWEQDAEHRVRRIITNARTPPSLHERLPAVMGRARWELDGMRPTRGTWEDYRAMLEAKVSFHDFEFSTVEDPEGLVVLVSGEPVHDVNGTFIGYRGASRDISALRRAEREAKAAQRRVDALNQSLEDKVKERTQELEQANAELEAIAYSIAHDLRGPMTSLAGFARLLESSMKGAGSRQSHYLHRILENVRGMDELAEALLSLARLSATEIQNEVVDLSDAAREIIERLRSTEPLRATQIKMPRICALQGTQSCCIESWTT